MESRINIRTLERFQIKWPFCKYEDGLAARLLFYIPFGIWLFSKMLYTYTFYGELLSGILPFATIRIVCLGIIVVREIAFGRKDALSAIGFVIALSMGLIANNANFAHLVDAAFFIFAARNMKFRPIARFSLVVLLTAYCLTLLSCAFGILPDVVYATDGRVRHTIGFTWPNSAAAYPFYMFCIWLYLRFDKLRIYDLLLGVLLSGILFALTVSRAAFLASIVLLVLTAICKYAPSTLHEKKLLRTIAAFSVVIVAVCVLVLVFAYDPSNQVFQKIDSISAGRVSLAHGVIEKYGVPLLGQRKSFGGVDHLNLSGDIVKGDMSNLIDCIYPKLLVHCGILFFLLAIALCTIVLLKASKKKETIVLVVFASIAIHGIYEPFAAYLHFNVFLFLLGMLFSNTYQDG